MKYLVDSDWVADYLKGKDPAVELLGRLAPEGLAISIIIVGEIDEGILFGQDRARYEVGFRNFLRGVEVLPLTRRAMRNFAEQRGNLRQRGELIGDMDLLIAATALDYHLALVTRNQRHFGRIQQLEIYQAS